MECEEVILNFSDKSALDKSNMHTDQWLSDKELSSETNLYNIITHVELLCFWTLSIILFLFKTQRFGDWILHPPSGTFR
jgi:hypothetical protein